ncbi:hypothetical protein LZ198_00630 [Myxococcus sp. K15C18031901]|uniref:hypothetical protein n=1 Tax=Myxococcus dinghuensis TaxID=2906761 RepID=UPI0020A8118A|nr:hypothetical protein [Myxococcus dinghuensis]MCP3097370.1 hypothetical protein [Myxococcus dinghuensis]
MNRRLGSAFIAVGLLAGCGGVTEAELSTPEPTQTQAETTPLTSLDVDVAPECEGILDFVNRATYATLDFYLPSNVASGIVNRRVTTPFVSIEDISAIPQVAEARLKEIEKGARAEGYLSPNCIGIYDELALSVDDSSSILHLVNSISSTELHDMLPNAWTGATNLLNTRPFETIQAVSNTSGIGIVSLRHIRNAATLSRPLENLAYELDQLSSNGSHGGKLARHFDWWTTMRNDIRGAYGRTDVECFGIDEDRIPADGPTLRANLATPADVLARFEYTVQVSDRYNVVPQPLKDAAKANLVNLSAGRSFVGCSYSFEKDPWSGDTVEFFYDPADGFGIWTHTYWSE